MTELLDAVDELTLPQRHREEWKVIQNSDGLLEVSTHGRVREAATGRVKPLHLNLGYPSVSFKGHSARVHRLVAEAFLERQSPKDEVRHLNGDPTDNHVENLAWGSHAENMRDQVRHGTHGNASKTHCKNGHPLTNLKPGIRGCASCRADNVREWARQGLPPDDPRHGTSSGFRRGCGCAACVVARRAYFRPIEEQRNQRRKAARAARREARNK